MNWVNPTGKTPKIVTLVALGPSRNAYIAAQLESDLDPAILGVEETWTLNRGFGVFRHDLCFVMDNLGSESDKYPRYGAALWKHNRPIITSDNCEGWPAHVHRYPFLEIWDWMRKVVNPMHGDWHHNSVSYILAYAAFIGVRELRVFGADYTNHSSGVVEDGHPCVAYWAGRLESQGLTVLPVGDSSFLGANRRDWLYGYKDDPRKIPANRARFRAMVGLEAAPESTVLLSGERQVSESLDGIQPDHRYRYEWAAAQATGWVIDFGGGIGYGSAILADAPLVHGVLMVERSAESIEYAKQHYARDNIDYQRTDLDNARFYTSEPGRAECATAFEIIEHMANPRPFLESIPVDRLFASVPNETVVPYSPESAPFHHRHYRKRELEELLNQCGWKVEGWYGQTDPCSPVIPWQEGCRTLIVEAVREAAGDGTVR